MNSRGGARPPPASTGLAMAAASLTPGGVPAYLGATVPEAALPDGKREPLWTPPPNGYDGGYLGTFDLPDGLRPGTTPFGQYAHEQIGAMLRDEYGIQFIDNIKVGRTGIDLETPPEYLGMTPISGIKIKPLTESGLRAYNRQLRDWGLSSKQAPAVTYDRHGNFMKGFK